MSYYASGEGRIYLNRDLTELEKDRIGNIFDDCFSEVYAEHDTVDLVKYYNNYNDDSTMECLKCFLNEFRSITVGGSVEFAGEDNSNWRFALTTDEAGNIKWVVQDGYIEWGEMHDI